MNGESMGDKPVPPKPIPARPGRGALAARMAEILRVDHAGEMAAVAIYRGQRVVPHRRRSFGWFATVGHWDVEDHEVQIDFDRDRVRDVQARVRRSRLTEQPLG